MNNLEIWNKLGKTDPDLTKSFDNGRFKGTAISPVYCYSKMTEAFGPIGKGWKAEFKKDRFPLPNGEIMIFVDCALYTKEGDKWSEPIMGSGGDYIYRLTKNGPKADDDAEKKACTDAITNAMKFLGMSADVHMGKFDDVRYVENLKEEMKAKEPTREDYILEIDFLYELLKCTTTGEIDELTELWRETIDALPGSITENIKTQIGIQRKMRVDGILPQIILYKFKDVQHGVKFCAEVKKNIQEMEPEELQMWILANDEKLKAIDTCLKAEKYQTPEGSPYTRIMKSYNLKIKQPQAAE